MGTFTPDSLQVVYEQKNTQLLSARDGTLVRDLSARDAGTLAVRRDGKLVVTGGVRDDRGRIQGLFLEDGKVAFDGDSSIAFWGSDDWVFAATSRHNVALQKLQSGEPDLL